MFRSEYGVLLLDPSHATPGAMGHTEQVTNANPWRTVPGMEKERAILWDNGGVLVDTERWFFEANRKELEALSRRH